MKSTGKTQEGEFWYDPTQKLQDKIDLDFLMADLEAILPFLKKKEADIVAMLMDGFGIQEIADQLGYSRQHIWETIRWVRVKLGE